MSHIMEDGAGTKSEGTMLPIGPSERWPAVFRTEAMPAVVVELEALRHNRRAVVSAVSESPVRVRIATRALRSTALLRHLLMDPEEIVNGSPTEKLQGLACDTPHEALALLDLGFDDILIHAPICTAVEAQQLAAHVAAGKHVVPTVDCREHVTLLSEAARKADTEIGVCIDVDVSWQPAAEVRFGRLRSPLGDVSSARDLGTFIAETDGTAVVGVSAWASQVADAALPSARKWWTGPLHGWMNTRSIALAADRRVAVVESLKADGHAIRIVNGGSSATLTNTVHDGSVTELTIGGAFLCPMRCDSISLDLKPAVFFVAPVCRIPDGEHIVVRSAGTTGLQATPLHPEGLRIVGGEGLWSHQTPLSVRGSTPAIGTPVVFRPRRVAPLFDRFEEIILLGETEVSERATTYRGIGIGHL
jgi:D-serine deaminase-like pyridoxal phosphate-dependent protein